MQVFVRNSAYITMKKIKPKAGQESVWHFLPGVLQDTPGTSFCEFKGSAAYYDVVLKGKIAARAAWHYPYVQGAYGALKDHVAVYAHLMDTCYVNDEAVQAQEGDFYGGWITSNVVGPFKGGAGTWGW